MTSNAFLGSTRPSAQPMWEITEYLLTTDFLCESWLLKSFQTELFPNHQLQWPLSSFSDVSSSLVQLFLVGALSAPWQNSIPPIASSHQLQVPINCKSSSCVFGLRLPCLFPSCSTIPLELPFLNRSFRWTRFIKINAFASRLHSSDLISQGGDLHSWLPSDLRWDQMTF